jgi:hypothetical protein
VQNTWKERLQAKRTHKRQMQMIGHVEVVALMNKCLFNEWILKLRNNAKSPSEYRCIQRKRSKGSN